MAGWSRRDLRRDLPPVPPTLRAAQGRLLAAVLHPEARADVAEDNLAALAAHDHPIDPPQIDTPEILQERLDRQEAQPRRRVAQHVDPRQAVLAILDADAEPDLRLLDQAARQRGTHRTHPLGPLGQHLVGVP